MQHEIEREWRWGAPMRRLKANAIFGGLPVLLLATPAASDYYSLQQSNTIAAIAQANVAHGNCPGQEAMSPAIADVLREAGFIADPYKSPDFERAWRANTVELYGLLNRSSTELCAALWQRLGPAAVTVANC